MTMNKQTKTILSILGVSALAIPIVLLVIYSSKLSSVPSVPETNRQIDTKTIDDAVKKASPTQTYPTPGPASASAFPDLVGSPSAR